MVKITPWWTPKITKTADPTKTYLNELLSTFLTTTGDSSEARRPKNFASKYGLANDKISLWACSMDMIKWHFAKLLRYSIIQFVNRNICF